MTQQAPDLAEFLWGDVDRKIADLEHSYRVSRQARDALFPTLAQTPPNRCRYCGGTRQIYPGAKLDGHTKCVVSDEFKRQLATAMKDPRLTYKRVAEAFDVTHVAVRAWYREITEPR